MWSADDTELFTKKKNQGWLLRAAEEPESDDGLGKKKQEMRLNYQVE